MILAHKHLLVDSFLTCSLSKSCAFCKFVYLFCLGDLVTRTGVWEIQYVSERLADNPGELTYTVDDRVCKDFISYDLG